MGNIQSAIRFRRHIPKRNAAADVLERVLVAIEPVEDQRRQLDEGADLVAEQFYRREVNLQPAPLDRADHHLGVRGYAQGQSQGVQGFDGDAEVVERLLDERRPRVYSRQGVAEIAGAREGLPHRVDGAFADSEVPHRVIVAMVCAVELG